MRGIKRVRPTPPAGLPDEQLPTYINLTPIALPKLAGGNLDLELRKRKKQRRSRVRHLVDRHNRTTKTQVDHDILDHDDTPYRRQRTPNSPPKP